MITLQINKEIENINLSLYSNLLDRDIGAKMYFEEKQNHHRLLTSLSKQLPDESKVADLGTLHGASALSLSINPSVNVVSYDITMLCSLRPLPKNITLVIEDAKTCVQDYVDSKVILLDIDPHNDLQEKAIINLLLTWNYKGILICDDIHLSKEMEWFWNSISLKKYDVTKFGHWSGTGLVVFDETEIDVVIGE